MSTTITKPLLLDETGHLIVEGIARQNLLLAQMVTASTSATSEVELAEIHAIVQSGEAENVFNIGDQLMLNYNDGSTDYVLPWDIVHFDDVTLEDGETVPGMYIQSHYAMQALQFDASEAIYVAPSALAVGTYYFTIGTTWGSNCVSGTSYYFTTTTAIPAGGLICVANGTNLYTWGAPDVNPSNWKVYTFSTGADTTALEGPLTLTVGTSGTSLGSLDSTVKYSTTGINNLQRSAYGYNRWSHSAMRQFLNSSAAAGSWWTAQNPFDRVPQQLSSLRGFMAGFDDAFLNIIKPVCVRTALNTASDSAIGTYEDTYDYFFLASLEQEYFTPQLSGVEGDYWEYWKRRLGLSSTQGTGASNANANHIRYGYNAKTTAQNCRLRSAYRGTSGSTWYVYTSGYANGYNAAGSLRCAPACVIC